MRSSGVSEWTLTPMANVLTQEAHRAEHTGKEEQWDHRGRDWNDVASK